MPDSKWRGFLLPTRVVQRPFQYLVEQEAKKPEGKEQFWSGDGK